MLFCATIYLWRNLFLTHSRLSPRDSRNLSRYGIRNRRLGIGMGSLTISPYVWIRINGQKRVRGRPLSDLDLSSVLHFLAVGDEQHFLSIRPA